MSVPNPAPLEYSSVEPAESRWFVDEVKPHEPRLRAWLARRFPTLRDIDDVVQESYIRLLRARDKGDIRSVPAFLFMAARNAACDVFRKQRSHLVEGIEDIDALSVIESGPNAAEIAASNQELEMLADAMRALPDRCRQVFTLRKVFGLSQREIAARLGIAEHTVEIQVCNGARKCAQYLRSRGVTRG